MPKNDGQISKIIMAPLPKSQPLHVFARTAVDYGESCRPFKERENVDKRDIIAPLHV